MPSQKVIDYVQDALKKGFSKKEIAAKLKEAGYTDKQIEEAIGKAKGTGMEKFNMLWVVFALIIISVIVFAYFSLAPRQVQPEEILFYMSNKYDCNNLSMTSEEYLSCLNTNKLSIKTSHDCDVLMGETRIVCESLAEGNVELCDTIDSDRYREACTVLHVVKQKDFAGCAVFDDDLQLTCESIIQKHPDVINAIGYKFYFAG